MAALLTPWLEKRRGEKFVLRRKARPKEFIEVVLKEAIPDPLAVIATNGSRFELLGKNGWYIVPAEAWHLERRRRWLKRQLAEVEKKLAAIERPPFPMKVKNPPAEKSAG